MKSKFSKGMGVRKIKTSLDELEDLHSTHTGHYTEIEHYPDTHEYHVITTPRDKTGSPDHKNGIMEVHKEHSFLNRVLRLHKNHPAMQPFPKEAAIETGRNAQVHITIAHPNYRKK